MQHWLNCGQKDYIFHYLLSAIVLDFMGFPFHKKDKFDVVKVAIEDGRGLNKTAVGRAVISVISNSKLQTTVK